MAAADEPLTPEAADEPLMPDSDELRSRDPWRDPWGAGSSTVAALAARAVAAVSDWPPTRSSGL